jgi:hypothetical protein
VAHEQEANLRPGDEPALASVREHERAVLLVEVLIEAKPG